MVVFLYFIIFLLSLIMTGRFLYKNSKVDTTFVLFGMLVNINSLGRVVVSLSEGLEMAIFGNYFLYIGGCFTPIMAIVLLGKISGLKPPKILIAFLSIYAGIIMSFVFMIGKNKYYYKSVSLGHSDGYSYLIKEYGFVHRFYSLLLVIYAAVMIYYVIRAIREREKMSIWTISMISGLAIAIFIVYVLERLFGSKISYLSVGYLIAIGMLIKFFNHVNLYDMTSTIISSIEKMKEYGYIVLDHKKQYITANDYIKEVFPVVKTWKVDSPIPSYDRAAYQEILDGINDYKEEEDKKRILRFGDRYFQVIIRKLVHRNKEIGYLLEFVDRTIEECYHKTIEDYNRSLAKEVAEKTEDILHIKDMMVLGMAELVESRDNSTGGHIKRTSHVVRILIDTIQRLNILFLDRQFCRNIVKAAPMHDLGKISIDDKILKKPGKLTEEEFEIIKTHSTKSAELVESILKGVEEESFVRVAVNVARYHHEKWNGTGYPEGLRGTDIPLEARIMAVADVYDALVSKRCYKKEMDFDEAAKVMLKSMGSHFDPALKNVFLSSRRELEAYYMGFRDLEEENDKKV